MTKSKLWEIIVRQNHISDMGGRRVYAIPHHGLRKFFDLVYEKGREEGLRGVKKDAGAEIFEALFGGRQ